MKSSGREAYASTIKIETEISATGKEIAKG